MNATLSQVVTLLGTLSFAASTLVLGIWDVRSRRLPNVLTLWFSVATLGLFALAGAIGLANVTGASPGTQAIAADLGWLAGGAAAYFLLFLVLWLLLPAGIGAGDVKIAPLVGGSLGYLTGATGLLFGVILAALAAAVWGAVILRRREGGTVPFAVCLFGGAWFALAVSAL